MGTLFRRWAHNLDSSPESVRLELTKRHKAAAATVVGLAIAAVLLAIVACLGRNYFRQQPNPSVDIATRIAILILGLGSIVWRRTKFSGLRLKDIGALHGAHGLLLTLEKTTLQLSLIAAAIVLIGFIATLITGSEFYTYTGGAIGVVVLLYSYPTKSSWEKTLTAFGVSPDLPPPPPDLPASQP